MHNRRGLSGAGLKQWVQNAGEEQHSPGIQQYKLESESTRKTFPNALRPPERNRVQMSVTETPYADREQPHIDNRASGHRDTGILYAYREPVYSSIHTPRENDDSYDDVRGAYGFVEEFPAFESIAGHVFAEPESESVSTQRRRDEFKVIFYI